MRTRRPGLTAHTVRTLLCVLAAVSIVIAGLVPIVGEVAPAAATGSCTSSPADAYGDAVCGDNPIGYWRLDDTSCGTPPCAIVDETGQNDGTTVGSVTLGATGLVAGTTSASFGSGSSIRIPASGNAPSGLQPDDFTVEGWISDIDDSASSGHILEGGGFGVSVFNSDPMLEIQEFFSIPGATSSPYIVHNEYADTSRTTHHIVVTKDLDWMTLYVDGARTAVWDANGLVDAIASDGIHTGYDTAAPLTIGSYSNQSSPITIDEVALYDYVLAPDQIEAHFYANPDWNRFGNPGRDEGGQSPSDCPTTDNATLYPVALPSGVFWHTFDDFSFPGRGVPLSLSHTYNSSRAGVDGPLGHGWSMSYDMHLAEDVSGDVTIFEEGGTELLFDESGGDYTQVDSACPTTLVDNGNGTWTFTRASTNERMAFDSDGRLIELGMLIGDPDAVTMLAYDGGGLLETATDDAGRTLTFAWSGGHITDITDSSSPARSVHFDYASGDLVEWTDVAGGTWAFTYDANHLLLTMRDPNQEGVVGPPVITNDYDGADRVESQTDRLGRITTFDYTTLAGGVIVTDPESHAVAKTYSNGILTAETAGYGTPAAATTRYLHDPRSGQVAQIIDPNGNHTSFTYDANGTLTSKTDPLLRQTLVENNEYGQPTLITDPLGNQTILSYDANGNLETVEKYDNNQSMSIVTEYAHDDAGHPSDVTSMTDPNLQVWTYTYDSSGNRASVTDPLGNESTFDVNPQGWTTASVSARGNAPGATPADFTTTFTHNAFGDVLTATDPLGGVTTREYDANRNLVSVENPNGHTTTYVYDAENQLTEIHRPDSTVVSNEYWDDGRLKTQIDAASAATGYAYDPLGRLAAVTDPLNSTTSYFYDPAGNLTAKEDPGGDCSASPASGCTTFTYDAGNQLTSVAYSDGVTPDVTSITYDLAGRRTEAVTANATSTWSYNDLGWLIASDDGTGGVTYAYDANGHVTSIGYPNSLTVTRAFDDAGRLETSTDWNSEATTFAYDENGNLETITYPTGSQVDMFTYDRADRTHTITMTAGANTRGALDYTRDDNGQPTGEDLATLPGADRTWGYDTLERLTDQDSTATWAYDDADNLTVTSNGTDQVFNAANQLCSTAPTAGTCVTPATGATTYTYDSRGNRTTATPPSPASATTYTYDQANRLTGIDTASATYAYNADGLRTSKTINGDDTTFVWNKTASLPMLLAEDTEGDTTYYLYGPGELPYAQIADDTTTPTYLHHDQLGSTRLLTDASGTTTGAATYDAYGAIAAGTGTLSNLGYAGQYIDAESGFQYLRARYYDVATGQFTSRDPVVTMTRSPYRYASSMPTGATDPSGLACVGLVASQTLNCPTSYHYERRDFLELVMRVESTTADTVKYFIEWRTTIDWRSAVLSTELSVQGERSNGSFGRIGYNSSADRTGRRQSQKKPWYAHTTFVAQRGTMIDIEGTMIFNRGQGPSGFRGGTLAVSCFVPDE